MKKSELDVNQYLIRTDLAVETKEAMANQQAVPTKEIKG
ncbi:GPR endopeptidase, partial [Bacillus subtilis]